MGPRIVVALAATAVLVTGCGSGAKTPAHTDPPASARESTPASPRPTARPGNKVGFAKAFQTSAGPILQATYKGPKSGVTGRVWVWLPPEYTEAAYKNTAFPVITFYTGGTGVNYNLWAHQQVEPTQAVAQQLERQGKVHPFIMVMPVLQMSVAQDTECSDIPGQPKMGTWLGEDLPAMIKANFRTLRSRDGWGLGGASSGAFCATKLALEHPGQVKAAVSWCGYFSPEPTGQHWTPQQITANSPDVMIAKRPDLRLFLLSGDLPKFRSDLTRMREFTKLVHPPTTVTTFVQHGGGHFSNDLKKLIPNILEFFTQTLEGPQQA